MMRIPSVLCVLCFALSCAAPRDLDAGPRDDIPAGFADIGREIPGCVIDMRYATPGNFTGKPLAGYRANRAWGTRPMVEALKLVQADLAPRGYRLKVFDAYRPMAAERDMIRWAIDTGRRNLLGVYVPARVDPAARFGHVCGNMVDVTIIDSTGNELDMGTDYDEFSERAHTDRVAGRVLSNRIMLRDAMVRRGFRPYAMEWWHFTFPGAPHPALDVPIE